MKLKKGMWIVAKVAAVLAINATVLTVLVADEETGTQEASADIADFMPKEVFAPSSTTDIISDSGLTPREYDVNGNKVFFAVGETKMSPKQVLEHYQTEFAAAGVNSQKWLESPQQKINGDPEKYKLYKRDAAKVVDAMNDGEVVPYLVSDNYISMGGPIIKADNFEDIFLEWGPTVMDDPNRVMKGWRFIDATRTKRGKTRVTSVWADKDFDFKKFTKPDGSQLGYNDAVPACPGCKLTMRSSSKDEPMAVDQYMSQQDADTVADYYRQTMQARGWELSDTSTAMEFTAQHVPDHPFNTHGKMLNFSKGGEQVSYAILRTDTGTTVTATKSW